jgi:hypothetical protein
MINAEFIEKLKAGDKLDSLVAEIVIMREVGEWNPSFKMEDAWEVVVEMLDRKEWKQVDLYGNDAGYTFRIMKKDFGTLSAFAPTATEAICKAALLSKVSQ